jgi:hypothetical protein
MKVTMKGRDISEDLGVNEKMKMGVSKEVGLKVQALFTQSSSGLLSGVIMKLRVP